MNEANTLMFVPGKPFQLKSNVWLALWAHVMNMARDPMLYKFVCYASVDSNTFLFWLGQKQKKVLRDFVMTWTGLKPTLPSRRDSWRPSSCRRRRRSRSRRSWSRCSRCRCLCRWPATTRGWSCWSGSCVPGKSHLRGVHTGHYSSTVTSGSDLKIGLVSHFVFHLKKI